MAALRLYRVVAKGRRRFRDRGLTRSTFDKGPAVDLAIIELQRRYVQTGRRKPSMRELLTEGLSALLEREGLPQILAGPPPQAAGLTGGLVSMPARLPEPGGTR